ncbi:N-6 DNA Methylase [Stappia sp. ES.058]|nr:N-6 DNA Methylase [Stappia sp. ES.058]
MSQQLVNQYLSEIDRLRKMSGLTNEQVIRPAFRRLLDTWAASMRLVFLEEFPFQTGMKTTVYPDGTVLHDIRVPLGYWEAKDTKDDLDEEIRKKLAKGYPQDNIIFENSETAVLWQNRQEVMRADMTDTEALLRLVALFFSYERAEIAEFRKAVEIFKADLPTVLDALRARINTAYSDNSAFKAEADKFLAHCKDTINPALGEADVREMLIQHILTEEIFSHVFNESDFHHENNIAKELYALEGKFFTGAVKRETLKGLEPYYAAIRANAAQITNHSEKQTFLKVIYENFYKVYDTKKADRLGVVYTPNEIVKFMIQGADWLCETHFGRNLVDEHVEILDPATGTGTFICELLEYFRGDPRKLAHKYKNELHANEVAILPYYVANLNIEASYQAISGQFAEFPNLCFVDTLDNVEGLGIRAGHQHDMFAALSDENIERVKRQNKRKISVVVGNPPYNAWQENFNMRNANRAYKRIDDRIRETYGTASSAQNKIAIYDMYSRFFRWASDRMHDDGVLAFITNRSFIESRTFDGFRKSVEEEFNEIYVVDLGGDVRANPKLSGTKHNVFGIQTGVAISFFVKRRRQQGCKIFYARRPEFDTAEDKLAFLASAKLSTMSFDRIDPDKKGNWVNQTENDWDNLIATCDEATKKNKNHKNERAIFKFYGRGIGTFRDEWVYSLSKEQLKEKMEHFVITYERRRRFEESYLKENIKWDRELEILLSKNKKKEYSSEYIHESSYRPFCRRHIYRDEDFIGMNYLNAQFWKSKRSSNKAIAIMGDSSGKPYFCLSVDLIPDLNFVSPASGGTQQLPIYRYTSTGDRVDNITDWALNRFHKAYGKTGRLRPDRGGGGEDDVRDTSISPHEGEMPGRAEGGEPRALEADATPPSIASRHLPIKEKEARELTREAIFHYVYGVLHDPVYREKYALNLKREFPRIPFYPDFWAWADWGKRLMELHIGYEEVEPWPISRTDVADEAAREAGVAPKTILKADKDNGIIRIDSETTLAGIPPQVWDYKLGNRSGIEWILDQYKEKTPRDPTIREKFNTYRFADYKEKVIDLIACVTRVSVETMEIVEAMKSAKRGSETTKTSR